MVQRALALSGHARTSGRFWHPPGFLRRSMDIFSRVLVLSIARENSAAGKSKSSINMVIAMDETLVGFHLCLFLGGTER
jgi:hypothetical protein